MTTDPQSKLPNLLAQVIDNKLDNLVPIWPVPCSKLRLRLNQLKLSYLNLLYQLTIHHNGLNTLRLILSAAILVYEIDAWKNKSLLVQVQARDR
jgi:hypothetical protein